MSIETQEIVDCHHHLWNLDENYYPWLTDRITKRVCGEYSAIRKNYLLDDFVEDIGQLKVIKTVHVQAEHDFDDPVNETRWLSKIAGSNERAIPHGIIAWADLADEKLSQTLDQHCQFANVRGIRQMCHEAFIEPDAQGEKKIIMQNPAWLAGLKKLADYKLSFDLQFYYQQSNDAYKVVESNPNIQFIVVHTGQPAERTSQAMQAWREGLKKMALLPNCVLKISGLGMFDRNWTVDSLQPIILDAIDIFTPERCLFGSNFPVDGMMSSYKRLWTAYYEIVSGFSQQEKDAMFSMNSQRIYRL